MKAPRPFHHASSQLLLLMALLVALLAAPMGAYAREHTVTIGQPGFQPVEITIQTGDTVTWRVDEGTHIVAAEDGSFRSNRMTFAKNRTFTHTFNEPGEFPYTCALHEAMYEAAHVQPIVIVSSNPVATGMDINFGHGGSWYNPDEAGQGFSLEVVPESASLQPGSGQLVAYWFTFAQGAPGGADRLRWYLGAGPIDGSDALLDVFQVSGGVFDDPAATTTEQTIGSAVAHFDSCADGTFSYSLDLDGDGTEESSGQISLTRITPDVLCEQLGAN